MDDTLITDPPPLVAQSQEDSVQVDRQRVSPGLVGVGHQLLGRPSDAGVVDEHVEPAKSLKDGAHHALPVVGLGDVVVAECRQSARALDLGGDSLPRVGSNVSQYHPRAFGGEAARRGGPQTRRRAGDERNLALETAFPVVQASPLCMRPYQGRPKGRASPQVNVADGWWSEGGAPARPRWAERPRTTG